METPQDFINRRTLLTSTINNALLDHAEYTADVEHPEYGAVTLLAGHTENPSSLLSIQLKLVIARYRNQAEQFAILHSSRIPGHVMSEYAPITIKLNPTAEDYEALASNTPYQQCRNDGEYLQRATKVAFDPLYTSYVADAIIADPSRLGRS